ncbi:hypothetical protein CTI12_AA427660 [Artemisia annua]|uniref:Retrotransposon Copia-like N-terminal domain-containing protein n=1 Tax=Artemisia annua TaxID=35608 RepID=A0A2U1LR19_ARTAN|nr:hypothetical protein CTI12_AA427660 [Artemisia annua]
MAEPVTNNLTEPQLFQNHLYLHPSNGQHSLTVQEKLNGAQNYRAWRRAIEIRLSTKRKLDFIKGIVPRSTTDPNLAELWDTCNNMAIARSIMFIGTASEIWNQLEKRYVLSDGSRKYKLNKDTYEIKQSVVSQEVSVFLAVLSKQKEDQRFFQFSNGLDEHYSNQRSQILMIVPLPSVENACSLLQWEESQRALFGNGVLESTALLSKGKFQDKCGICDFKWHPPEKCWEKVEYPAWHPKYKLSKQFKPKNGQARTQGHGFQKSAAHVESGNLSFTPQQFDQLLKSLQLKNSADEDTEFAHDFAAVNVPSEKLDDVFKDLVERVTISIEHDVYGNNPSSIRECGVSFVYDDGKNEKEEDPLSYYKSWNHIIGGDLSPFQSATPFPPEYNNLAYFLDNNYRGVGSYFKAFSKKNPNTRGRAIELLIGHKMY